MRLSSNGSKRLRPQGAYGVGTALPGNLCFRPWRVASTHKNTSAGERGIFMPGFSPQLSRQPEFDGGRDRTPTCDLPGSTADKGLARRERVGKLSPEVQDLLGHAGFAV